MRMHQAEADMGWIRLYGAAIQLQDEQLFHASKGFDPPITSLSWLSVSSQRLMLFVIYDSIVDVLLRAIWLRPDGRDHI
jgi:hypothetical protein